MKAEQVLRINKQTTYRKYFTIFAIIWREKYLIDSYAFSQRIIFIIVVLLLRRYATSAFVQLSSILIRIFYIQCVDHFSLLCCMYAVSALEQFNSPSIHIKNVCGQLLVMQ